MGQQYERLSIEDFGKHLLETKDLDPVYVALKGANLETGTLHRWLIAYWCFYHCGAASWLSEKEGNDFWSAMYCAADNVTAAPTGGRWPRASERRHFRGQQAIKAVTELRNEYAGHPERMVEMMIEDGPLSFDGLRSGVKTHRGFGDWIAFKIGDMLERVVGCPVSFEQAEIFMYKDPRKAALMLWSQRAGIPEGAKIKDEVKAITDVVEYLTGHFFNYKAPPSHDRPVGLQEIETILCKWKSHMNGHYPLYNDIREIREGLKEWEPHSVVARQVQFAMPTLP